MKPLVRVVIILCTTALLSAAPSISGKWAASGKSPVPVAMEFSVSGAILTGTVRLADQPPIAIHDGRVDGDHLTFKAMITEGDDHYPIMFSGRLSRNRITFKCEVETNVPGEKTELGPACLQSLTVRRVN